MFSRLFRFFSPRRGRVALAGAAVFLAAHLSLSPAHAISIIRDAEIESIFRQWATPILTEARLNPDEITFHLVNDDSLNMFVAGGQRIFVHTGFILALDDPSEAIGVLAHEIGHIAGGHLSRSGEQRETAAALQIAATLLGAVLIGAGAATGSETTGGGAAVLGSAGQLGLRNFLAFSRVQESAADQAALRYLNRIGYTNKGLSQFLSKLANDGTSAAAGNPYLSSHPLTADRIAAVQNAGSDGRDANKEEEHALAMMQAKLIGFLYPKSVNNWFGKREKRDQALYAWAIADYRNGKTDSALERLDILIERHPDIAWYPELRGQILAENGRFEEAVPWYGKAMHLAPHNLLLKELYGDALVKTGSPEALQEAEGVLKAGRHIDPFSWRVHDALARLYYQTGRPALSDLSAAEKALLTGRRDQAKYRVERALQGLDKESPDWYRARDILVQLGGNADDKKQ